MELETFSCRLVEGEKYITLGPVTYSIVLSLVKAKGRRLTVDHLVELTWGYPVEEPDNAYNRLMALISKFRRRLRENGMSNCVKRPGAAGGPRTPGYWIEGVTLVETRQED